MSRSIHPLAVKAYDGMTLTNKPVSVEDVKAWYGDVDVLVTTSRGEGNNKPAMEFLATGGPVIATDWSGHQNWLHDDCCWRLPGELVEIAPGDVARDFRVDVEVLAKTLLEVATDPTAVAKKARAAHCKSVRRKAGEADVLRVLHRFNVLGASVETEIVR
jgi:glycosyltransferase involved in cell wall biosynthesis